MHHTQKRGHSRPPTSPNFVPHMLLLWLSTWGTSEGWVMHITPAEYDCLREKLQQQTDIEGSQGQTTEPKEIKRPEVIGQDEVQSLQ